MRSGSGNFAVGPSLLFNLPYQALAFFRAQLSLLTMLIRIPNTDTPSSSVNVYSAEYLKQSQRVLESMRQAHEEEAKMWKIREQDLLSQITVLQAKVQQLSAVSSGQSRLLRKSSLPQLRTEKTSGISRLRHSSDNSPTSEVWKGSGIALEPTRSFPEAPAIGSPISRLNSIPENAISEVKSTDSIAETIGKPRISSTEAEAIDGVTFKKAAIR